VKPGLNYCKHCGTELSAKDRSANKVSATLPESIIWAMVSVSLGGLALLIGLMAVMKDVLHFSNELIITFTTLSFLLLVVANSVVIWMAVRTRNSAKQAAEKTEPSGVTARELDAAQPHLLSEPMLSVTDHTTRTLDTANSQHKSD